MGVGWAVQKVEGDETEGRGLSTFFLMLSFSFIKIVIKVIKNYVNLNFIRYLFCIARYVLAA